MKKLKAHGVKIKEIKKVYNNWDIIVNTLMLSDRTLRLTFSWTKDNYDYENMCYMDWPDIQTLTFMNDEWDNKPYLEIELDVWYKFLWISYDKYDITISLIRKDIPMYSNFLKN